MSNILLQSTIISIASGTVNTTVTTTATTTTATTTTALTTTISTTTLLDHHHIILVIMLYMVIYACNTCCSLQYIFNTHGYEHRTILVPVMNTVYTKNRL